MDPELLAFSLSARPYAPRSGSHFLLTFCWLGQKVWRLAGRDPPVLIVVWGWLKAAIFRSTSPVPAGSRDTFFTGPKKVTKERAWLSPDFCLGDRRINFSTSHY